jgi:uncharacterized protein
VREKELDMIPIAVKQKWLAIVILFSITLLLINSAQGALTEGSPGKSQEPPGNTPLDLLETNVLLGDPEAQFLLGYMLTSGRGVKQDNEAGLYLLLESAKQDNADAQYLLGWYFLAGKVVERDLSKSWKWYVYAADAGNENAKIFVDKLAVSMFHGDSQKERVQAGLEATNNRLSPSESLYHLAVRHTSGDGRPKDQNLALRLFRLSARQGNAKSQFALGVLYEFGGVIPEDLFKAYVWWSIAGLNGHNSAEFRQSMVARKLSQNDIVRAHQIAVECLRVSYEKCN